MKILLFSCLFASAVSVCRAGPMLLAVDDEESERDSVNANEVGPDEDWTLFNRFGKSVSPSDRSDTEKTRELLKEVEKYSRLVTPPPPPRPVAVTDQHDDDDDDAAATTGRTAAEDVFETDSAAASDRGTAMTGRNGSEYGTDVLRSINEKIAELISTSKNW